MPYFLVSVLIRVSKLSIEETQIRGTVIHHLKAVTLRLITPLVHTLFKF